MHDTCSKNITTIKRYQSLISLQRLELVDSGGRYAMNDGSNNDNRTNSPQPTNEGTSTKLYKGLAEQTQAHVC